MSRWMILAVLLLAPAAYAQDPPPPNPGHPVNYVEWANETFGNDITENAAPVYVEAARAIGTGADDLAADLLLTDPRKWSAEDRDKLRTLLANQKEALEKLALAARKRECYFELKPADGGLIQVLLPELAGLRRSARLTAARSVLRMLDGDVDGARADVETLLKCGAHLQRQPMLIQYLVGAAIDRLAYDAILEFPRLAPGEVDYARLSRELARAGRGTPAPLRQLQSEKALAFEFIQRYARDTDDDGLYDTIDATAFAGSPRTGPRALAPPKRLAELVEEVRAVYEPLRGIFVADYAEAKQKAAEIEHKPPEDEYRTTLTGILWNNLASSLWRVAIVQRRLVAQRRACHVVLHLHAYRAEHGQWPEKLQQALHGQAERYGLDPFSNRPFGYKLKDGEPWLWTVGENGVDDGGQPFFRSDTSQRASWGPDGDYVYWPRHLREESRQRRAPYGTGSTGPGSLIPPTAGAGEVQRESGAPACPMCGGVLQGSETHCPFCGYRVKRPQSP
jgi:hypothetical protein